MKYFLNISRNGRYVAATQPIFVSENEAVGLYNLFKERFTEADGFKVELNRKEDSYVRVLP